MLKTRILSFLCFFLCLISLNLSAQTFPTKHYTIREGLAQMQVMALLEDSRGILWVGTKGGLSKYDGQKFKNYRRADGDSLTHDVIFDLKEDSQGNIWIGNSGGINKFNGAKFQSWRFPNPQEGANRIFINKKNEIIVHTGYETYQLINNKFQKITLQNTPKSLTWFGVNYDYDHDKLIFTYTDKKPNPTYSIYELNQNQLKLIEKNEFLFDNCYQYGDKGLIYTYRKENEIKKQYWFLAKGQKERKLIVTVNADTVIIHQTLPFNFAFGFQNKLSILEKNTFNYPQLADNFLESSFIQVDKTGIWAGTEVGLWRVMDNGLKYLPTSRDAAIWSMVEDKYNRLWTLHYNTIVPIKVHEGTKTIDLKDYQEPLSKQIGKPFNNNFYYQPLKDQYQNLWLPSENGLIRYDYNKFQFVFDNTYAFFLTEDKKRNLILSGVGGGVNIIENKPPYKVTELREKDGLHPNLQMLCVFVDSKGKHWYGGGGGLTTYDYEHKKAFRYKMKSEKVPFYSVFFISEDARGTLWFGTTKGLFRYLPLTDSFVKIAEKTITGFIYAVSNLDKKHLICVNGEVVFVLNLDDFYRDNTLNIKTFNYNNGFMGLEPGQAGIYKTHDDKTWITSSDVLSIFDPKDIDLNVSVSRPIFTKIDEQNIPFTKATQDSVFQLPQGKIDGVRIEFGSTGFDKALNPKFSYQLDNAKWSNWQEEPFVILFQLNNGSHIFKVKTQVFGEQKGVFPLETSLRFRTNIHFWQSPNFTGYLLSFTIFVMVFAIAKWIYEWRLRKKLESQQQELEFLKVAANQAQMNPHFIFNILQVLQSYIITEKWQEAKSMVVKLGDLVRNYLEATMIDPDNAKRSIFSTEISLSQEIDLLTQFIDFEQIKGSNKFSAKIDVDESINIGNLTVPPMIVQPIVENAIKHGLLNLEDGETGELTISLSFNDNILCFIVSDTGVGKEKAAQIKAKALRKHISRGEELVMKRIELLKSAGYKITIESEENQPRGTRVTICFDYN